MNTICYLSGIGLQEIIFLVISIGFIGGILAVLVIIITNVSRRKKDSTPSNFVEHQTPILRNAPKLEKLKSLHERGIISREEFEIEKGKILENKS